MARVKNETERREYRRRRLTNKNIRRRGLKQCARCLEAKGLGEYGDEARTKDGLKDICDPCLAELKAIWRQKTDLLEGPPGEKLATRRERLRLKRLKCRAKGAVDPLS